MRGLGVLARRLLVPITPGAARAVVTLFALMVALAVVNLLFTTHEISANNRQWCDTMNLLTSQPVPRPANPAANPSRMQAYTLYVDFATLRDRFGCQEAP